MRRETEQIPWKATAAVFLSSVLVCAAFGALTRPLPVGNDAGEYLRLAENIGQGVGFTLDGETPHAYRPPLFSALLGAWFFLTGTASVVSAQLYQSLCVALSAVFTFFLAREVFPGLRAAVLPGLLVGIHPSLVTHTAFVLQEPTLLLATTGACWTTLRWFRKPGTARAALSGAAWGVATLGKTVTLFIPFLLAGFWWIRRKRDLPVPAREMFLAVGLFAAVVLPWTARNYHHFHRLIPVNDQGMGMLEWNVRHADPADPGKEGVVSSLADVFRYRSGDERKPAGERFVEELDANGVRGEARRSRMFGYVADHWRYFLAQRAWNAAYFTVPSIDWWIHGGKVASVRDNIPLLLLLFSVSVPFYLFLALRVRGSWKGSRTGSAIPFLAVFFLCYWFTYALLVGEPRFSLPVYPVLFVLAPWERWT